MGFIRWGGKKFYPQKPKPYKPDINELMKPLSEKVGKGNIWGSIIMNVPEETSGPSVSPTPTPTITSSPTPTPSITPTQTITPTPTETPTPTPTPSPIPCYSFTITRLNQGAGQFAITYLDCNGNYQLLYIDTWPRSATICARSYGQYNPPNYVPGSLPPDWSAVNNGLC